MLITFSGIDASGKSTQIALLVDALRRRGRRVATVWFRPGYSVELDTLRRWVRQARPSALPTVQQPEARQRAFASPGVRRGWTAMALADTLLQLALKLRAALLRHDDVICDRYVHDALLDLRLKFPEQAADRWWVTRGVAYLVPRPDVSLLLHVRHDVMLRRMAVKNEPFPEDPEARDRRFQLYEDLAAQGGLQVVDASGPIEVVHAAVLACLDRRT